MLVEDATRGAKFDVKLKEQLDPLGVDCLLYYPGGSDARYSTWVPCLIARLRPASP